MAYVKISGLGSSTAWAATDLYEVDNAGVSKSISNTNLFTGAFKTVGQLAFPVTQAASADANTLDDYEEGTWTPTGNNVSLTVNTATYTKIGRTVLAQFDVTWPATADVNNATMSGLPFTNAAANTGVAIASSNRATFISAFVAASAARIDLYSNGILSNANVSGERFIGTAVYFA